MDQKLVHIQCMVHAAKIRRKVVKCHLTYAALVTYVMCIMQNSLLVPKNASLLFPQKCLLYFERINSKVLMIFTFGFIQV